MKNIKAVTAIVAILVIVVTASMVISGKSLKGDYTQSTAADASSIPWWCEKMPDLPPPGEQKDSSRRPGASSTPSRTPSGEPRAKLPSQGISLPGGEKNTVAGKGVEGTYIPSTNPPKSGGTSSEAKGTTGTEPKTTTTTTKNEPIWTPVPLVCPEGYFPNPYPRCSWLMKQIVQGKISMNDPKWSDMIKICSNSVYDWSKNTQDYLKNKPTKGRCDYYQSKFKEFQKSKDMTAEAKAQGYDIGKLAQTDSKCNFIYDN